MREPIYDENGVLWEASNRRMLQQALDDPAMQGYLTGSFKDLGPLYQTEPQSPSPRVAPGWLPYAAAAASPWIIDAQFRRESPSMTGMEFIDYIGRNADPQPNYSYRDQYSGPLSRGSRYMNDPTYIPGEEFNYMHNSYYNAQNKKLWATDYVPSHEIPGYDRMVNEGYDSWSPSDSARSLGEALPYMTGVLAQEERDLAKTIAAEERALGREYDIMEAGMNYPVDNRSDWQKWKDSFKKDWEAK